MSGSGNIVLPTFPALATAALFLKGFANNGGVAAPTQYLTFGHAFQIGQVPSGTGLSANFGAGAVACQVDVKTRYSDGSAAHAIISVQVPSVAAGATAWGQFSAGTPPGGTALSLAAALASATASLTLAPTALPDWTAGAAVAAGAIIAPKAGNAGGYSYQCTAAGTAGATQPVWPQAFAASVTDGGATWQNIGANFTTSITEDLVALVKPSADLWLSGPLAVQGRAMATLWQGLRMVVDCTAYADGTVNFDVMLANDIAMLPVAGTLSYTATLALNGSTAYTSPALTHYQYQNWTAQAGTAPGGLRVVHDPADFIAAQAVQPYDLTIGVAPSLQTTAASITASAGFGQPLTNPSALVDQNMGDVGGRNDIGPNDYWIVWGFVTQDPTFEAVAFEAAKVSGAIPWHWWNANTGDYIKVTDTVGAGNTTGFWPAQQTDSWTVPLTQAVPTAWSGWSLDNAHFPELVYLPYLTTGRRYYLDELNAATWGMLDFAWPPSRDDRLLPSQWNEYGGTDGLCTPGGQIRGGAWVLRNILYSTYASPDGSQQKAYASGLLDANFTWLNQQTATWSTFEGETAGYIPVGICCNYGSGDHNMPPWQQDYFFSSVAMAATMGYAPAQTFAEWMAGFIVGGFATNISGWAPQDRIAYNWIVFPNGYAAGDTPPQTWAAEESLLVAAGTSQTSAPAWTHQAMGDYAALAWNSLVNAENLGIAGAAAAQATMTSWNIPQALTDADWASNQPQRLAARTLNASQVLASAAPAPAITAVALSADTFAYGAPAGTVVGAISVTMSTGTFSGTLSLAGADAADFAISGTNLVTVGSLAAGAYAVSIVATQAGATDSPFTQAETITGASAPAITAVALSADTFAYGAPSGTVVGAISVAMSTGTFSGTLSLAGADAADFSISGTNLVTVGSLATGDYEVSIVATEAGATGSPFTEAVTITGASPTVAQLQAQIAAAQAALATAQSDLATATSDVSSDLSAIAVAINNIWASHVKNAGAAISAASTAVSSAQSTTSAALAVVLSDLQAVGTAL